MIGDAKASVKDMFDRGMLDPRTYGECQRKVPYLSKKDAMNKSAMHGVSQKAYKCEKCGKWHLTTSVKTRKPIEGKEERT